jgi:hypothetical protein
MKKEKNLEKAKVKKENTNIVLDNKILLPGNFLLSFYRAIYRAFFPLLPRDVWCENEKVVGGKEVFFLSLLT